MAGFWFVLVERRRGELGIGLLSLRFGGARRRRKEEDIWLEASGDLGLTSPVPPQRPLDAMAMWGNGEWPHASFNSRLLGPTPTRSPLDAATLP